MKKKLLTTLLAAVLCTPQVAFAARDGEGMQYTSASEGFYGSIRTQFRSKGGANTNNGASIEADGSRLGVRGSLDLGHGLTGLYRYEWEVFGDNGANPQGKTRLSYVGLRGSFGEIQAGSLWANDYNWVTAGSDIATTGSGNFAPVFRAKNNFQYTSPDINGFQGAIRFGLNGGSKTDNGTSNIETLSNLMGAGTTITASAANAGISRTIVIPDTLREQLDSFGNAMQVSALLANNVVVSIQGQKTGSESIDEWAIAAKYATHGFTFGASYQAQPDKRGYAPINQIEIASINPALAVVNNVTATVGLTAVVNPTPVDENATFWALRLGYGQDNWGVNAWYGEHNTSERGAPANVLTKGDDGQAAFVARRDAAIAKVFNPQDTEVFSIAGNIDLGKIALVAIYEQRENEWALDDNVFLLNADYKFTSRSKAYIAYIANDFDSDPDKDDEVRIGLRMDF